MTGRIIVLTGHGKGKTTAAFGMALRAAGHGNYVIIIQFLKKGDFGELRALPENIMVRQFGCNRFVITPQKEDCTKAEQGLSYAASVLEKKPFMLILDEINVAMDIGLLEVDDVISFLEKRAETHVVLTGRNVPPEILECADIVTELINIRHCFDMDAHTIKGLEF